MKRKYFILLPYTLITIAITISVVAYNLGYKGFSLDYVSDQGVEALRLISVCLMTILSSYFNAENDYEDINNGEVINHSANFISRVLYVAIIIFLCKVSIVYMIPCAGLFSFTFNFFLNRMRNLPMNYVSKSNLYDRIFINLFNKQAGLVQNIFELGLMAIFLI